MATGIAGLDLVLGGGLEPGATVVLAGAPGTGKTILAQQMCFATAGRRCVYYTTISQPHARLVRHLETFGFFDPRALGTRVEQIHLGEFLQPDLPGGLGPMVAEIVRKAMDEHPAIVVLDSAKMLREFADERELRRALFEMVGRFSQTGAVLLLVGEYTPDELGGGIEFSLADGIIQLDHEARMPVDRRGLRIIKMRGGSFVPGRHALQIGSSGIEVFPRIETLTPAMVTPVSRQVRSTGVAGLDELMGGGTRRGDSTLVMGPSGVGKTTFGLRFITEELELGEQCLFVTFQDTPELLLEKATGFGWDVGSAMASGQLVISYVPMGDLDLDVLAATIRAHVDEHPVSRIVIDSLAELVSAAREWDRLPAYLRSLIGIIQASGSSLMVTSETPHHEAVSRSVDGLMFLFDNVIDLRYIEQGSQLGRAINIVKMRKSAHLMTLNTFAITSRGIVVGDKLEGVTGRLGRSALRTQSPL